VAEVELLQLFTCQIPCDHILCNRPTPQKQQQQQQYLHKIMS